MDALTIKAAIEADETKLAILAYAQGFTLWSYSTRTHIVAEVASAGFFSSLPDILSIGDMVMISAADGSAIIPVTVRAFAQNPARSTQFDMETLEQAAEEAANEAIRAVSLWAPMNSAHEGFAVLMEEVDELKTHVWTKQSRRDLGEMRKEAIQVAAMALRFAAECCGDASGRV